MIKKNKIIFFTYTTLMKELAKRLDCNFTYSAGEVNHAR